MAAAGYAFGLAVMVLALFGAAAAIARRRWAMVALLPFQLSLTATYTMFFAEPRYRLPIEMLAFPFVALALGELARLPRRTARLDRGSRTVLIAGLVIVAVWWFGWPRVVSAGQALRARHRWGASEVSLSTEPRPRLLLWRAAPPLGPVSPLAGAPEGVHLRADASGHARAQVQLAGGPLPAGMYALSARITAQQGSGRVTLAGGVAEISPAAAVELHAPVAHLGGILRFDADLAGSPGAEIWVDELRLDPAQ
jgi:hypothetical protein